MSKREDKRTPSAVAPAGGCGPACERDRVVSLRFLGTGGARWVVAKQIRASGGFWLQADGTNIHVDPGQGTVVRARVG